MFMAGDKIRIHVYEDPQHRHELYTANYGKPLEVYEKDDVPGYHGESTLGVDWTLDDGETVFTPLDDFGEPLVEIADSALRRSCSSMMPSMSSSEKPMMALRGVRISWLTEEKKKLLAFSAAISLSSAAWRSSS